MVEGGKMKLTVSIVCVIAFEEVCETCVLDVSCEWCEWCVDLVELYDE